MSFKKYFFIAAIFFSNLCLAYSSNSDDYCRTTTFESYAMHDIEGGLFTGFGYAVYCGNNPQATGLSRSLKSLWPSKSKASEMITEVNNKIKGQGFEQAIDYSKELPMGNLNIKIGAFVKNEAALQPGEALCLIVKTTSQLDTLACSPGAVVNQNMAGPNLPLETILLSNGYTQVAPFIYRK